MPDDNASHASESASSPYVEGKAAGRLEQARELCAALARKHHRSAFGRLEPIIAACDDPARLREWALTAAELTDAEFLELLGIDSKAYAWERGREVQEARDLCAKTVRRSRPLVYRLVWNVIDRCNDTERLKEWTLAAQKMTNDEFFALINSWEGRWRSN